MDFYDFNRLVMRFAYKIIQEIILRIKEFVYSNDEYHFG